MSETRFCWASGVDEESALDYRFHSPVIMIEFDHQKGVAHHHHD